MVAKRFFEILVGLCLLWPASMATAQDNGENAAAAREAQIADKFMQVLLRRPAPGTALDRVYGYHVQAGSLDATLADLKADVAKAIENKGAENKGTEDAGAKAMLLGLLQLQRGADAEAAESLARAETLRPDDAMVSYHLGKALLLIGRGEAAADAFERSIDRKPARNEALPVFTELGRLYGRSQQNEKALAVWNRLEETFPGDTRVGEQIAQTLAEEGQDEAALARYEALAKKTADSADARGIGYQIAAAELKRRVGKSDEALADFEAILGRLRPSSWLHSDVRRRIEAGFLRSGDYAALAEYYTEQVRAQPDALELRMRLGQVQSKAGLLADAETTLTETVELAPGETEPRLALVDLFQATAKYTEAAEQLRALVEQDAENPDYLIRLGNTILEDTSLEKGARQAGAAEAWQQLAEVRKEDAVITAQVGDLMRRIDRNDDAIAMYQRAVELAPEQPQYREYLGEFLNRLGRKDEAMAAWNSIAEGDRATRDNLIRLAEVLNTFDHPDKALEAFGKAAEMDPTFAHRLRYTELLTRAEKYDDALLQLDASEISAETPEEREQLLRSRIGVYASSGTLEARTDEARSTAEASGEADDYRRLSLMLDASARTDDALAAIESAMKADDSDIGSMEVAAELYRKSSRSADAITIYRRLAEVDSRFLPNYLKRIASLHMELGQVDEALAAADELIAAGPGNPESYRFYAEQCFRVGRDDEGIERLRRALRAAPRDRDARRALASALDDRFRTDEAIELYWALLEDNDDLSEQRGLVKSLSSLYGRKGDFDRLLGRLELRGREASDMRTATLLISEAHRAMDDLGAASAALEPLLAENPRDAELIGQLVELSQAADDLETALQYQERLTKLADTPENRNRELKLLIDSGQMDRAEASLLRMQSITDPLDLIDIIDRSMNRMEAESVVRFSQLALEKDPGLWEVRPRLVAGLLETEQYDQALAEIETILALDLPDDTSSEKRKDAIEKAKARMKSSSTPVAVRASQGSDGSAWIGYASGMLTLTRYHGMGRYANYSFSMSYGSRSSIVDPQDVLHAKVFADTYRIFVASKQGKLKEFAEAEGLAEWGDIDTIDDPERLKKLFLFKTVEASIEAGNSLPTNPDFDALTWQLIKTVPEFRSSMVYRMLQTRASLRSRQSRGNGPKVDVEPLTDDQMKLIGEIVADIDEKDLSRNTTDAYMAAFWYQELKVMGKEDEATSVREMFTVSTDTSKDAMNAMMTIGRFQDAESTADLIAQVRQKLPTWTPAMTSNDASSLGRSFSQIANLEGVDEDTKLAIADMAIALQAIASKDARRSRRSSSMTGTVNTYFNATGNYQQLQLQVPLAAERLPSALVSTLAQGGFVNVNPELTAKAIDRWKNADLVLADNPALAQAERELRDVLVAYSYWWSGDVEATYDAIVKLSQDDPEDNDWWIERARLAAELRMPEASLEALDSINPMDQATLQIRELAAMNLASQLGDLERAKTAAQRLFGMRLDAQTELALSDQLTRLGMREMAAAVLQRSRRRGGQSVSDLLSLADRYAAAEDVDAAAEIAYSAMRKLSRGGERNEDYYRRRAVEKLRSGGRLDAIIEMAEKRVASSPTSLSLKSELAQLYTAAGRKDDADKVFAEITKLQPNDPKTMWETAKRLNAARKYDDASVKFATAAVKDPSILNNGYFEMTNCIRQCKDREPAYKILAELNLASVQGYMISQLVDVDRSRAGEKEDGEFETAFLGKVLKECGIENLADVLRTIVSDADRLKSKPVADAVRRVLSSDEMFEPTGQVWQRGSYGGDGRFFGIIDPCLQVIAKNDELRDEMQMALRKRIDAANEKDTETGSPIAEIMLVATQIGNTPEKEYRPTLDRMMKLGNDTVPYQLWWQIGQVLEKDKKLANLTVEVFEKGVEVAEGNNQMREYQYSINPRLADAYVAAGMKDKAREKLLEAYANTDNSEQNQWNPGYGDYQDLQAFQSIAAKLVESGSRLAAIPIYAEALSNPAGFERAKQWGGRDRYKETFEKELASTIESLTDEDFAEYLTLPPIPAETKETTDDKPRLTRSPVMVGQRVVMSGQTPKKKRDLETGLRLYPMMPTTKISPDASSVAAIVTSKLAESETGRELLADFDSKLAERLERTPGEVSLVAMRALIATKTEQANAPEHFARLSELVPDVDPESKTVRADANVLALYSPALVGLACEDGAIKAAADGLADRLINLADKSERKSISETLVLAKIRSGGETSSGEGKLAMLGAMLDRAAPATTPPKVLSEDAAEDCIRIAETAVAAEAWTVVIDAIQRALGGGPPLRNMGGQTGSTFLLQAQRNTPNRDPNAGQLDGMITRVHGVLGKLMPELETDSELAERTYEALVAVVMPSERQQEIFPHATDLIRPNSDNPFNRDVDEPKRDSPSVAASLAKAAVACGKVDELKSRLAERRTKVEVKPLVDWVAFQVAWAVNDADQSSKAFEELAIASGVIAEDAMVKDGSGDVDDSGRDDASGNGKAPAPEVSAMTSLNNQATANVLLHAAYVVFERDGMTPAVQSVWRALLKMAAKDPSVSQAGEHWQFIAREVVKNTDIRDEEIKSWIELYHDTIRQRYAPYDQNGLIEQQVAYASSRLSGTAMAANRFLLAAELFRPVMFEMRRQGQNANSQSFSSLHTQHVDAATVFDYWSYLMFGPVHEKAADANSADEALFPMVGYAVYAEPPAKLADAAESLAKARAIKTVAPDFPLESIGLALALSAAECERTDGLIERLGPYVKKPGDETEAMIGLAMLAAGRTAEAGEVLERVAKQLKESAPAEKVDGVIPHESAILLVRAFEVESLRDTVKAAYPELMNHVRNRNLGNKTGYYNKVMTRITDSFASATSTDTTLDHFVAYQTPYTDVPVAEMNKPKWAVVDETLRYGGGMDVNLMMLKYPLAGDFTFEIVERPHPWGGFSITANGTAFAAQGYDKSALAKGLVGRGEVKREFEGAVLGEPLTMALIHRGDEVVFRAGGEDLFTDARAESFPFVGLFMQSYSISEAADVVISGNPTIPREVNLLHPRLRGWSSQIFGGNLPSLHLPLTPDQDAGVVAKERDEAAKNAENLFWVVVDDELQTGVLDGSRRPGSGQHIHYQRPLLDGETVSYEFRYEPDAVEVHPTVGRVMLLMRPDGLQLKWLPQYSSMEVRGPADQPAGDFTKEFSPDEVLGDGPLPLKAGNWNTVAIAVAGDLVTVTLNGQPVARTSLALDRRPGIYCEDERKTRVRNITLSGEWPETLPKNLLGP